MSISAEHLRRLNALGLSADAMKEVLDVMADVADDGSAKRMRAERNRRYYEKKQSENVLKRLNSASENVLETSENVLEPRAPIRERVHGVQQLVSKEVSKKDQSSLRSDSSTTQNAPVDLLGQIEKIPKAKIDRSACVETIRMAGEGWNAIAATFRLPEIDSIKPGSTREKRTLARVRDLKADYDLDAPEGLTTMFTKIRGSPYLRGEVNGFVCTFDWIVNPTNFTKIMEGNYEVRVQKNDSAFGQPKRHHG